MQPTQLLNEQMNANETKQESGKLIDYIKIEGTPFTCVVEGGQYYGVMGNYVLTEKLYSYDDVVEFLTVEDIWNTVLKMILILMKNHETIETENNNK